MQTKQVAENIHYNETQRTEDRFCSSALFRPWEKGLFQKQIERGCRGLKKKRKNAVLSFY